MTFYSSENAHVRWWIRHNL